MLLDHQLIFSDAQALTVTANSTNILDLVAAHALGSGEHLVAFAKVGTVVGTPTLTIALVAADDVGFSTNKITVDSRTPTLVAAQADALVRMAIPFTAQKRFWRMEYTVGGGTPQVTVTSGIIKDEVTSSMT